MTQREGGWKNCTCPVDVSNHTPQVNRRDPIFNDLLGRGFYSSRNKLFDAKDQLILPEQQERAARKKFGPYQRKKGKGNGPTGLLPKQA